jgi:hypothetical protein
MNSKVNQMIVSLATDKVADAKLDFESVMSEKINAALDERKIAIASEIYSKKS